MFRKAVLPLVLLLVAGMFLVGCDKPKEAKAGKVLCGGCGQIFDVCDMETAIKLREGSDA